MTDTTTTPPAPVASSKGGRPKGSRNRSTVAAEARAADAGAATAAAVAGSIAGPAPKGPGRPSNSAKLRESIANLYTSVGAMLSTFGLLAGQQHAASVGTALVTNADACATALANWADVNPRVRKALESLATAGGAGVVLAAHGPIIMAAINPAPLDGASLGDLMANFIGAPAA